MIGALISIFQAASLRDRYYTAVDHMNTLEIAIEDIERINANSANPNALISGICSNMSKH